MYAEEEEEEGEESKDCKYVEREGEVRRKVLRLKWDVRDRGCIGEGKGIVDE